MVNQSVRRTACADRLLKGIQGELGSQRARYPPTYDGSGKGIDDESDVNEALPGLYVGEICHPESVWPIALKLR